MLTCPHCGAPNPDGSRFCDQCGVTLAADRVCPDCGAQCAATARFCNQCGHDFSTEEDELLGDIVHVSAPSAVPTMASSPNDFVIERRHLLCYKGNDAHIVVPEGVTHIDEGVFENYTALRSIVLPSTLVEIGNYAFCKCVNLTSITIPSGVTRIGLFAFSGCGVLDICYTGTLSRWCAISDLDTLMGAGRVNSLSINGAPIAGDLVIPADVTAIGYRAFAGCCDLTSVVIANGVTAIGMSAFEGCRELTSMAVPDSVTFMGINAFAGCCKMASLTIPFVSAGDPFGWMFGTDSYEGGVATVQPTYGISKSDISYGTYFIPSALRSVTVSGGRIPDGSFAACKGLTDITLGDGVTSIGHDAFKDCSGLRRISIGCGVIAIGRYAFQNCSSLNSIIVGSGVKTIGTGAFCGCSGLTEVYIGANVESVEEDVFLGCPNVTVYCAASKPGKKWDRHWDKGLKRKNIVWKHPV